jgi:Phosphoglyceromutase
MPRPKPLVLTILDGWGFSPASEGNAIAAARKPTYDALIREFPNTLVHTSGPYVGLPEGQMGNSEVGHLNIGAGRVVYMDVTRIDMMIASGDFFRDPALLEAMKKGRESHLHLMGLLSNGGVHSQNTHLYALLKLARQEHVKNVFIHCFMDGRDTPPESGAGFLEELQRNIAEIGVGRIASVSGRTMRWTATSAGTGWSAPSTRWCWAPGRRQRIRWRRCGAPTRRASRTNSLSR